MNKYYIADSEFRHHQCFRHAQLQEVVFLDVDSSNLILHLLLSCGVVHLLENTLHDIEQEFNACVFVLHQLGDSFRHYFVQFFTSHVGSGTPCPLSSPVDLAMPTLQIQLMYFATDFFRCTCSGCNRARRFRVLSFVDFYHYTEHRTRPELLGHDCRDRRGMLDDPLAFIKTSLFLVRQSGFWGLLPQYQSLHFGFSIMCRMVSVLKTFPS